MEGATVEDLLRLWAGPEAERVLDCFAGLCVRGLVCGVEGYEYVGVDCWAELNAENRRIAKDKGQTKVHYVDGDARTLEGVEGLFDFAFVSPPYHDLEPYSGHPKCFAECKTHEAFIDDMGKAAKALIPKMKPGKFVCLIIGDKQNGNGGLDDLIGDTRRAFSQAGLIYHERITLVKPKGTAALRAANAWRSHKLVNRAEVALIFEVPSCAVIDLHLASDGTYSAQDAEAAD
jgi:hypothetical protein